LHKCLVSQPIKENLHEKKPLSEEKADIPVIPQEENKEIIAKKEEEKLDSPYQEVESTMGRFQIEERYILFKIQVNIINLNIGKPISI